MTTAPGPAASTTLTPLPAPGEKRRLELHRRRAIIGADRIDIRPSRAAALPPLFGFLTGLVCVGLIVLGVTSDVLPYWLLAFLLLIALLAVPLTGITLVYALIGANVIFDRRKQSGTWQQGLLGLGIGTTELVPFWKIEAVVVTEAGAAGGSTGRRTEEFAQWEVVLLKKSGKRLRVAGMTVPRRFAGAGLAPVRELAEAIAALAGAEVRVEAVLTEAMGKRQLHQLQTKPAPQTATSVQRSRPSVRLEVPPGRPWTRAARRRR